jgi:hypothetical protein
MTDVSNGWTTRLGRVVISLPCAVTIMSTRDTHANAIAVAIRATTQ